MAFKLIARLLTIWWVLLRFGLPWIFLKKRRPELVRRGFEFLGPTYIKLGQIVASSPGLFPPSYVAEFQRCLDQVPPFPFPIVERIVAEETGRPLAEVFASVDPTPIAAASIAQVHAATLHDGTDVVIKVQRPKILDRVDADLWMMRWQARVGERLFDTLRMANLVGIIEDFDRTLHEELDFAVEGRSMDEFNEIMVRHHAAEKVCAPKVYWDTTSQRLLTMERFYGFKADAVEEAERRGIDSEQWLRTGMRAWMMTMMLHGFFHGDVHAGNLMFMPDRAQIGFIDFGIVGRFSKDQRMLVMRYVLCFVTEDYRELAQVMSEMGAVGEDFDLEALASDMERVYSPILAQALSALDYGKVLPEVIGTARKHGLQMPREFVLILKQLLYFDRYAKLAAPNLNVFTDVYLVDFLFTPEATACGVDLSQLGKLLMGVQRRLMELKGKN